MPKFKHVHVTLMDNSRLKLFIVPQTNGEKSESQLPTISYPAVCPPAKITQTVIGERAVCNLGDHLISNKNCSVEKML